MTNRLRRYIIDVLPLMLICGALAAYIVYAVLDFNALEWKTHVLRTGWSVVDRQNRRVNMELHDAGEPVIMTLSLNNEFDAPRDICFYSVFQSVDVRLDGEQIYSFEAPVGKWFMRAAPSHWNTVSVPAGSAGKLLEIELVTPYQQYADVLPEVRSGTEAQIERYVELQALPRFIAALVILFIGVIFTIVAIAMRYYALSRTGLYSLSLFIVVFAIFLAAQQTTILLEITDRISYILLQHVAFMLCPILYSRYLIHANRGRRRTVAKVLFTLGVINAVLITTLQLTGVCDMPQVMGLTGLLSVAVIIYAFVLELLQKRRLVVFLYAPLMIYAAVRYYSTDTITWLVYAGIFVYLFVLLYRIIAAVVRGQAKQIRLESALENSRSEIAAIQITSHFFYHTLDSIRALIRIDADRAYKMTGDFAKYVRHRVDGVERMQETVPFSRELRAIRAYTDIKLAQLGERFQMEYDIETEDFEILPLTVQPLVENAVIHAVQLRREGGHVWLKCRETAEGYHIEVIDNGPGPNAESAPSDPRKKSTAIQNVNTRLEFYGIAPVKLEKNDLGGMTASLDTPKKIVKKGEAQ